jgi:hypothetical protein
MPEILSDRQMLAQTLAASKAAAAAALAGGLIAASGRPHTLEEALTVLSEVHHGMFPAPGSGRFDKWASDDGRFSKIYT